MKLYKKLTEASQNREEVTALKISVKGQNFPEELIDFPNLTELYLEGDCTSFPLTSPVWGKLKILSIKWPKFSGDLSSLFSLPTLENLKIIETPITSFLLPLGKANAPIKSLTIKDCGLKLLPEEFSMLIYLQDLNLSGNNLSKLPFAFTELKNLKRLNLDHNKFEQFPDSIKKMSTLSHLSIDGNSFSDDEKDRIQREFHIWVN